MPRGGNRIRGVTVVYRWCHLHEHVEKGHRHVDGHVVIVKPETLAEAHRGEKVIN